MYENLIIHEVGLRDGIQGENKLVDFDTKVAWATKLIESGVDILQLGSFVNPAKVPQMADTEKLFQYFENNPFKTEFSGLILNEKGMERALNCGVSYFCLGVSASNTHSVKNTGLETMNAIKRIIPMALELQKMGKKVQVSIQSAFGCGFEGKISEDFVLLLASLYFDNGINNLSLADTAGFAYPSQVSRLYEHVRKLNTKASLTCHFHNTYGLGMANVYAAINEGVTNIETAFGGLGGCPFTKVTAGNVPTEDFVFSIQRNVDRKDISIDKIIEVTKSAEQYFEKRLEGFVYKIGNLIR